jgi:hypothetical protein
MKPKLMTISILIACAAVAWMFFKEWKRKHPSFANTEQFINYLAAQAVADAQKENHVTLDYSIDSLKQVDQVLGHVHDTYVTNTSAVSVNGLSAAYGAYVGEVIHRHEPNSFWARDSKVAGEKSYPLHWGAGESYPMRWCSKRIVNGDEDLIWVKYDVLKKRQMKKSSGDTGTSSMQ